MKNLKIAGRFHKVYGDTNIIVIGFLGNISAYNISDANREYILKFYNIKDEDIKNITIIKDFNCINNSHFNDYLYIELRWHGGNYAHILW